MKYTKTTRLKERQVTQRLLVPPTLSGIHKYSKTWHSNDTMLASQKSTQRFSVNILQNAVYLLIFNFRPRELLNPSKALKLNNFKTTYSVSDFL